MRSTRRGASRCWPDSGCSFSDYCGRSFGSASRPSGSLIIGGLLALAGAWGHYVADPAPHLVEATAGIDPMPLVTSYLGLALAGAMFLALGLWVSSLVRNQLVAALVALALNLVFILGGLLVLGGFVTTPSDTQPVRLSVADVPERAAAFQPRFHPRTGG